MLFFTQFNNILDRCLRTVRNNFCRKAFLQHSYYYFLLFVCTALCKAFCNTSLPLPF